MKINDLIKYDIIIFEGVDRIGKTSTKKIFEKLTNYKYIVIDRMLFTAIAYEKLKNRNNNIDYYKKFFKSLCKNYNVYIIYLYTEDLNLIKNRIIDEKEEILKFYEVERLQQIYFSIFKEFNNLKFNKCLVKIEDFYNDYYLIAKYIIKELSL